MKTITLFGLVILASTAIINAQNVITVDNSPGSSAQFSDLQSAISAATAGDVIYVHPSETNYGNINMDKPLTLIGFSHSDPQKRSTVTDIRLLDGASNCKFSGLYVTDDFYTSGNATTLENLIIENCRILDQIYFSSAVNDILIRGNYVDQIGSTSGSSSANNHTNVIITNNIITNYIGFKNFQSTTIKNNIFLTPNSNYPVFNANADIGSTTIQNCILYYDTPSTYNPDADGVVYDNCLSYNIGTGSVATLIGSNNLDNQDPLFNEDNENAVFEPAIDDYSLQAGSPAIGAGVNAENLGLFDGSGFVFDNFGFTDGVPTVKIQAISTTVAPGQNLNIIINSSNQ